MREQSTSTDTISWYISRSMTNPFRPLAFRLCPWLPAAKPYHMRHRQLYQYWEDVVRVLRSRGAPDEADTSCQACLRRLRNPETGTMPFRVFILLYFLSHGSRQPNAVDLDSAYWASAYHCGMHKTLRALLENGEGPGLSE
jgi:hypothetical protein